MSSLTRRSVLLASAAGASSFLRAGHDDARSQPRSGPPEPHFVTPETQTAIDLGLAFIARSQRPNGGFAAESPPGGTAVGVAAVAGLALLAGGHHPGRGRYARNVSRVADYLLAGAGPESGFLLPPGVQRTGTEAWSQQTMYSHGFGCLFLGELCGTLPDPVRQRLVRAVLERAVGYTVAAQAADGGWRYTPLPEYSDASVTVAHLMALRAARNAGVLVRKGVVEAGIRFLLACQRPDGGFGYTRGAGEVSMFARSAAALVGLFSAGLYNGPEVERGLRYLLRFRPGRSLTRQELPPAHYFYAHYYSALAMWTAGGEYWAAWAPAARTELLARARDGVWDDRPFGAVYATAMSLIVLQLSDHYLPILQA